MFAQESSYYKHFISFSSARVNEEPRTVEWLPPCTSYWGLGACGSGRDGWNLLLGKDRPKKLICFKAIGFASHSIGLFKRDLYPTNFPKQVEYWCLKGGVQRIITRRMFWDFFFILQFWMKMASTVPCFKPGNQKNTKPTCPIKTYFGRAPRKKQKNTTIGGPPLRCQATTNAELACLYWYIFSLNLHIYKYKYKACCYIHIKNVSEDRERERKREREREREGEREREREREERERERERGRERERDREGERKREREGEREREG